MSVLQYFIPGSTAATIVRDDGTLDRHQLDGLGMLKALRDLRQIPRDATVAGLRGGPGGQDGVLMIPTLINAEPGSVKPKIGYFEDTQVWQDMGRYWIGTERGVEVTSYDLRRRRMCAGYNWKTDEGIEWWIPTARQGQSKVGVTLPRNVVFKNGKGAYKLQKSYLYLAEFADEIVAWREGNESLANDESWRMSAALSALSVNYRVWEDEIEFLSELEQPILTSDDVTLYCNSLADYPLYEEAKEEKKTTQSLGHTESEASDSDDAISGIEDGDPITSQAGVSC